MLSADLLTIWPPMLSAVLIVFGSYLIGGVPVAYLTAHA